MGWKPSLLQIDILELLYERQSPSTVAKRLRRDKSTVSYHLKILVGAGLLALNAHETSIERKRWALPNMKVYGLTAAGLRLLQDHHSKSLNPQTGGSPGGEDPVGNSRGPRVEIHNFEVKLPIRHMSIEYLPNAAEMTNWTRKWDPEFHGVFLEVTTKSVLLRARAEGASVAIAEGLCLRKLIRIMELLQSTYGCELGPPQFRRVFAEGRTKVGVVDHPLTKGLQPQKGELADIDNTPEEGTLHPRDPNDADQVVQMARNISDIREGTLTLELATMALQDATRQLIEERRKALEENRAMNGGANADQNGGMYS